MKTKVLVLEQQSWMGGAQRVLEVVLKAVIKDVDPIIMFPKVGPFSARLNESGFRTCTFPLGTYRSGRKSYAEGLIFIFRSIVCALKIILFIHKHDVRCIYINGPRCLPAGVMAGWFTRRPSLFHLHLILTRRSELLIAAQFARHVSRIVACSQAAAESLLEADPRLASKTLVLYNPALGTRRETPGRACRVEAVTFGMVGRITETKGHHIVLSALGMLGRDWRRKTRLIIVGAPAPGSADDLKYLHRLAEYAAQQGLDNQIQWAGYQADPDSYYDQMDSLLQPSFGEALGLTILEALQHGLPVIASRTGGIPEIIKDGVNGLLVSPDEDALLAGIRRFLEDEGLRDRLREGARAELDSRFSVDTFKISICHLVRGLSGSGDVITPEAGLHEPAMWK
jgi:glycosyltransferase involved in cell wall biosynthesis